jgi:hypothetical protein
MGCFISSPKEMTAMSRPRAKRACRPCLDRLEDYCLLSIGLPSAPVMHALVHEQPTEARAPKALPTANLMGTQIEQDLYQYMRMYLPSSDLGRVHVSSLTINSAGTLKSTVTAQYHVEILGTVTATVKVNTNIANPTPKGVSESVTSFGSLITASDRRQVYNGVVNFIEQDYDQLQAAEP